MITVKLSDTRIIKFKEFSDGRIFYKLFHQGLIMTRGIVGTKEFNRILSNSEDTVNSIFG